MLDYYALEALSVVLRTRNFERAAQILHITQSAISQRILSLERQIGRPLLVRKPILQPTATGQRLISHFDQVVLLENSLPKTAVDAEQEAYKHAIPIALNTESLATWFIGAVANIVLEKGVVLELLTADQDRTLQLLRKGYVLGCISSSDATLASCTRHALGTMNYWCVATPKFKKEYLNKLTSENVTRAPAAIYGRDDQIHQEFLNDLFSKSKPVPPYHFVPSPEGLVSFVESSLAYALLPELLIRNQIQQGTLVDVADGKRYSVRLFWHVVDCKTPILDQLSKAIMGAASKLLG